ncbi:50S ribosomal protein L22 [bacterium]|nr:50S ribosomal protein L22 [bacterium]|tara:strand:- start:525 stop:1073 length:549 start_codon:yes stop_codon:yes gene_type:complete
MKEVTAKLRHKRIAPRKARLVVDLIRGLPVKEAEAQLSVSPKRASIFILRLLRSAAANAKNRELDEEKLYIKEIKVDNGPMLKRWIPRARGSASSIQKKTSHITVVLGESDKITQPKYVFIKKEKEKKEEKTEKKGKKTEKKEEDLSIQAEKKDSKRAEKELETKGPEKSGGIKRFFRRKSI